MELSAKQVRQLRKTREFRHRAPTVGGYFRSSYKGYLFITLVSGFGIVFFVWAGWPSASSLFAGLLLATVLRDLGWYSRIVRSWPLTREITDWERVDELLMENERRVA